MERMMSSAMPIADSHLLYSFLMPEVGIRNRNPMRNRPILQPDRLTGGSILLDIIFIAIGAGTIAGLALYASGLARI